MPDVSGLSLPEEAEIAVADALVDHFEDVPEVQVSAYAIAEVAIPAALDALPAGWLLAKALTPTQIKNLLRHPHILPGAESLLRAALRGGGSGV